MRAQLVVQAGAGVGVGAGVGAGVVVARAGPTVHRG